MSMIIPSSYPLLLPLLTFFFAPHAPALVKRGVVKAAVVGGDLNWDDWSPRNRKTKDPELMGVMGGGWEDVWMGLKGDDPGYTYDCSKNEMMGGR